MQVHAARFAEPQIIALVSATLRTEHLADSSFVVSS
jgi:hypothetical protein